MPQDRKSTFEPQLEKKRQKDISDIDQKIISIHYSVRDNGIIRKLAAYVILGMNNDGYKEVLTIEVGENESAKYWLSVLNGLKSSGTPSNFTTHCTTFADQDMTRYAKKRKEKKV